jgi:hypothetical protein
MFQSSTKQKKLSSSTLKAEICVGEPEIIKSKSHIFQSFKLTMEFKERRQLNNKTVDNNCSQNQIHKKLNP